MNKIHLKSAAKAGDQEIPPGEYVVSVTADDKLQLIGHGKNYDLPTINRKSGVARRARRISMQFYNMGGVSWTVAMIIPQKGELVSFIDIKK